MKNSQSREAISTDFTHPTSHSFFMKGLFCWDCNVKPESQGVVLRFFFLFFPAPLRTENLFSPELQWLVSPPSAPESVSCVGVRSGSPLCLSIRSKASSNPAVIENRSQPEAPSYQKEYAERRQTPHIPKAWTLQKERGAGKKRIDG